MKTIWEHRVPLCGRAMEILEEARTLEDGAARLIFTREGGKPLGCRSVAQTAALEPGRGRTARVPVEFPGLGSRGDGSSTREVVEAALAHVVKNKVEAAYRRTDLFERRRRLMDDWANYLDQSKAVNE